MGRSDAGGHVIAEYFLGVLAVARRGGTQRRPYAPEVDGEADLTQRSGVVVDGGVRDVSDVRRMGLPVWARVIHAAGTVKATPGSVNLPVTCGGVTVGAGDVVVADDDGVVIVERDSAPDLLGAVRARLVREAETRARLASGELGLDIYGFRERLEGLGVRWVDSPEQ